MQGLDKREKDTIRQRFRDKNLPLNIDLTFDDINLGGGQFSTVRSRGEIGNFSTGILTNLRLSIPFVSANMQTVTGPELAIALEREGGLACLPPSLSLEKRLQALEQILRADSATVDQPLTAIADQTLSEAKKVMAKFNVSGLVIIDESNKVIGILSHRDWIYETSDDKRVVDLMRSPVITIGESATLEDARELIRRNKIEKLPIVDRANHLKGLITARGLFYQKHYPRALRDEKGRFIRVGSIGVTSKEKSAQRLIDEVEAMLDKGIIAILIDTARANSINGKETIEAIRSRFPDLSIIAGNVCDAVGTKNLISWGADCVKVGIGPGKACRTRKKSGIGIPQVTAIAQCSAIANLLGKTTIADGGIDGADNVSKALIAGADAVMIGSLFCGTKESPPIPHPNNAGFLVKTLSGEASQNAQRMRQQEGSLSRIREPEGEDEEVPLAGTLNECVEKLLGGLQSSMSYWGVRTIAELKAIAKFRRQTRAGHIEGVKE